MTDHDALLAAVKDHPDDDTPRLVYADWCDDAGLAERAAFVRASVELARVRPRALGPVTVNIVGSPSEAWEAIVPHGMAADLAPGMWVRVTAPTGGGGSWKFDAMVKSVLPCHHQIDSMSVRLNAGEHPQAAREAELDREANILWTDLREPILTAVGLDPGSAYVNMTRGFIDRLGGVSAEDWIAHGDKAAAVHPVRQVDLTTVPQVEFISGRMPHCFRFRNDPADVRFSESDMMVATLTDLMVLRWPSIAFGLPLEAYAGGIRDVLINQIRRLFAPTA